MTLLLVNSIAKRRFKLKSTESTGVGGDLTFLIPTLVFKASGVKDFSNEIFNMIYNLTSSEV